VTVCKAEKHGAYIMDMGLAETSVLFVRNNQTVYADVKEKVTIIWRSLNISQIKSLTSFIVAVKVGSRGEQ